jgi:hypothetical protein
VPGIRAKKHHSSSERPHRRQHTLSTRGSSLTTAATEDTGSQAAPNETGRDELMPWPADWHLESTDSGGVIGAVFPDDTPPSFNDAHRPIATTEGGFGASQLLAGFARGDEYGGVPGMLEGLSDIVMSPTPSNPPTEPSIVYEAHDPEAAPKNRSALDSQCVQESCQVINYLETYVSSGITDFKIILGIVRQAMERVASLVSLQRTSGNSKCLLLFTTIICQILALIEVCLPGRTAAKSQLGSTPFGFGIGVGEMAFDAEELALFRSQTLLKETHQVVEILGQIKTLSARAAVSRRPSSADSIHVKADKTECFEDLEERLQEITRVLSSRI